MPFRARVEVTAVSPSAVPVTSTCRPLRSTVATSGSSVSSRSSRGADGLEADPLAALDSIGQPCRRVERDDPPAVDERDPVAEALGLVHEVGDQQDRDPSLPDDLDEVPGVAPGGRARS